MEWYIITFHDAYNYGAVLQAYALQKFLEKNFGKTTIINYHNNQVMDVYKFPNIKLFFVNPKKFLKRVSQYIFFYTKRKNIDLFTRDFAMVDFEEFCKTLDSETMNSDKVIVVGSDQIWNYQLTGLDGTYFASFAHNVIKISYAASFGVSEIPEKYQAEYSDYLKELQHISVREEKAKQIVQNLIGINPVVSVDPTLLLNQTEWCELTNKVVDYEYILVYKITHQQNLLKFANKLSKEYNLPIIYIPNDVGEKFTGRMVTSAGPKEWLSYIKYAKYVVTNSFHGTVFSTIFEKDFYCEVLIDKHSGSSRLESFLSKFNLEDRIIHGDKFCHNKKIDWLNVRNIIEQERSRTYEYFDEIK